MAIISEGDSKALEAEMSAEMDKILKHFEHDLLSVRSGKASAAMVEDIMVECYGSKQKLKGLASISVPDARLIVIQPWDKTVVDGIFKAIQSSDLGVTPVADGNVLRIQLPVMSTERRDELVKVLKKKVEEAKVKIRNVRREYNGVVKDAAKNGEISEDFAKRVCDQLQEITDGFIAKIEDLGDKKEHELKLV